MSTYLFYMYKNSEYAKAEKSRVTQNHSYMYATVGLLSLIIEFSCLVATSDFDRLRMFDRKYAKPRTSGGPWLSDRFTLENLCKVIGI